MLVREVMTPDPVTATPKTTIKDALRTLADLGVTSLPVVGNHRHLRGVVSEADLIQETLPPDPRAQERPIVIEPLYPPTTVDDVYTRAAVTVHPEDDAAVAVELMTSTGAKSLPVVDDERRVVGVVSRSDVVRQLARSDSQIAAEIDQRLVSVGHDDWLVEVVDGSVTITGPADVGTSSLAHVVARTVPGVVNVRVSST